MAEREYSQEHERERALPGWSVRKLARDRFFWVVWARCGAAWGGEPPIANGVAADLETATEAARQVAGPAGRELSQAYAAWAHREQAAARRAARRPSTTTTATPLEFIYAVDRNNEDNVPRMSRHQIFKRTAKKVFADEQECSEFTPAPRGEQQSMTFDRAALERDDGVSRKSQGWWGPTYFATEAAALASMTKARAVSRCFAALGLTNDCTLAEVRRTYRRLALIHHPDKGGDAVTFRELHAHYEQACRMSAQRTDEAAD